MSYTIGEVSKKTGISVPTLRYYDKEGLFNNIQRTTIGNRKFNDQELITIEWISCLKTTGMTLKEIKVYLDMNKEGDNTLEERLELFNKQEEVVKQKIKDLEKSLEMIKIKQWWYETSIDQGTEEYVKNMDYKDIPEDIFNIMKKIFGDTKPN